MKRRQSRRFRPASTTPRPHSTRCAVHGYRDNGNQVQIADSANPNTASYWINTSDLANWMATRGYSH